MLPTSPLLAGSHVLLVEDEYMIADEMERWLRQAGVEVVGPVPDVEQALNLIDAAAGALDAAVLDVNLGGVETASPIAERLDELGVPYLFATGDARAVGEAGYQSHPHLDKPVSQRDLLRVLGQLLQSRPAATA